MHAPCSQPTSDSAPKDSERLLRVRWRRWKQLLFSCIHSCIAEPLAGFKVVPESEVTGQKTSSPLYTYEEHVQHFL